jgi:outer membrane receptor protein involved in Fe transport
MFLDRSNPTGDIRMSSYTVVDAGWTVQWGAVRVNLSLDNVFDADYEQFVGFPAQGRRLRAELRAAF